MKAIQRTVLLGLVIGMLFLVPVALAGNVHFNSINFSVGSPLVVEGDLVTLEANQEFEVALSAAGAVIAMCENRAGAHAHGHNPVPVEVSKSVMATTDASGHTWVVIEAPDPTAPDYGPLPTPEQAGCPNGNWTVVDILDGSTDWTTARIVFTDEAGVVQADLSFTCTTFFEGRVGVGIDCQKV